MTTNLDFANSIVNHPAFIKGQLSTGFIDEHFEGGQATIDPPSEQIEAMVIASTIVYHNRDNLVRESLKPIIAKVGPSHKPDHRYLYVVKSNDYIFEVELQGQVGTSHWRFKVNGTEYAVVTPVFEYYKRRLKLSIHGVDQYFRLQYRQQFIWCAYCGNSRSVSSVIDPLPSFAWVVAYSGISRELTKSGFNVRVEECHQAAEALLPGTRILSDIPQEVFEDRKMRLPDNLRKRATHFFTEVERVHQGAKAWQEANLEVFGQLMNQSCHSSINNYESGSDILIELHELISGMDGVYGSRFSGGGYGGCVIALVHRASAENICAQATERFTDRHPELQSKVFAAETGDGISPVLSGASIRKDTSVEAGS